MKGVIPLVQTHAFSILGPGFKSCSRSVTRGDVAKGEETGTFEDYCGGGGNEAVVGEVGGELR